MATEEGPRIPDALVSEIVQLGVRQRSESPQPTRTQTDEMFSLLDRALAAVGLSAHDGWRVDPETWRARRIGTAGKRYVH